MPLLLSQCALKPLSPLEAVIEAARRGAISILLIEDGMGLRGSLVVPAEAADAQAINFMARFGRGLVSLAITPARAEHLRLPPMVPFAGKGRDTGFAVSIEARTGVTTGISAADRARTVAVAINPGSTSGDLVTPGHVFPMVAHEHGLLGRVSVLDATVDLARLSGRDPSGVMCEVMDDDGTVAGFSALEALAARHCLHMGMVSGLVAHRRRTETLVRRESDAAIQMYGRSWRAVAYRAAGGPEHLALLHGDTSGPVPVHLHTGALLSDVLSPDRRSALQDAMQDIAAARGGVVILLGREGGLLGALRDDGTVDEDDRAAAAQILAELGTSPAQRDAEGNR